MIHGKRSALILPGLIGLSLVLFFIIFIMGSGKLSSRSKHLIELKLQSRTLDSQLTNLSQAKKEVELYSYFNAIAEQVIPNDKDQAQAVVDIFQLANAAGISIQSVTFPASTLGAAAATPAPAADQKSQTNAIEAPSSKVISQAKPVEGVSGLYSIGLTITPETGPSSPADKKVTYAKLLNFLKRIETNRRTAQVTQVNIQPLGSETGVSEFINFTLTVNIFIKP